MFCLVFIQLGRGAYLAAVFGVVFFSPRRLMERHESLQVDTVGISVG